MTDPTTEDITALRRDRDLSAYLRGLIRPTRQAQPDQADRAYGPHHQPGAWPAGTQPPTSTICRPHCGCALTQPPTTA
jgi:hypothetical protein